MVGHRVMQLATVIAVSGCGPAFQARPVILMRPQTAIYQDATGPLSYQAPTGLDTNRRAPVRQVSGEACQHGIFVPIPPLAPVPQIGVSWGRGGYEQALAKAQAAAGTARVYDVRVDQHTTAYLSIYRISCTEVHASAAP